MQGAEQVEKKDSMPIVDEELLAIQRRKSMPRVVIQEFVQNDSSDENDEEEKKGEDNAATNNADKVERRPSKLVTHADVENVSIWTA